MLSNFFNGYLRLSRGGVSKFEPQLSLNIIFVVLK